MFYVDTAPCSYLDPWSASFEDRFKSLCAASRRVSYIYEHADTSTFRYRVYNMVQVISRLGSDTSASYFFYHERAHFHKIIDNSDVIVICRTRYNAFLDELVLVAKSKGKKVLFDVDDLIFDTKYTQQILRTLDQPLSDPHQAWDHWFSYIGRIGAAFRMCDGAITTNEFLARKLQEFHPVPVAIVPNFLNQEQLKLCEEIYSGKLAADFKRTERIHLGYFSGTPTHNLDFEILEDDLADALTNDGRLHLLIVGFMDLRGRLASMADRIDFYPLHDFINLQRLISLVEINLVPLQENDFTNCKSELKYFEAAAVGTISIASPTYTYGRAITDGENGFLARSTQWGEQISRAISRIDNYAPMAVQAHDAALEKYAWYHQYPALEAALFGRESFQHDL